MRDCPLKNGKYRVEIVSGRPYARLRDDVTIKNNEVNHTVRVGIVQSAEGHRLIIHNYKTDKAAFQAGTHKVTVEDETSGEVVDATVRVQEGRTVTVP